MEMEKKIDSQKYLPIGSIVLLMNGTKKVMIIGYKPKTIDNNGNEIEFDYSGCIYPEGMLSSDQVLLFNQQQIDKLFFKGFENEESKKFHEMLNQI